MSRGMWCRIDHCNIAKYWAKKSTAILWNILLRSKLQHDGIFCKVAHRNYVEYRAKKPTTILSNIAPRSKLQHGGSLLHLPSVPSDCCNHHLHQKFCKLLQICQTYKMWLGRDGSEFSTILHGVIPVFLHFFARISKLGVI